MQSHRRPRRIQVVGLEGDRRAFVIVGLCVWEVVAILTGRIPTITVVSHRLRDDVRGRLLLWLLLGWLVDHIWAEGRPGHPRYRIKVASSE